MNPSTNVHHFSKGEALRFGWNTFKAHPVFFIGLTVIVLVIDGMAGLLQGYFQTRSISAAIVATIIMIAIESIVAMGLLRVTLRFVDDEPATLGDLFTESPLVLKYIAAAILFGLIVTVGFVLLIVPGIYLSIRYGLYTYAIVDREVGPIEALKLSARLTQGVKWNLFVFGLLTALLNVVGAILLIVGLVVTLPTTLLAMAYVYRQLTRQSQPASMALPV